MTDADEDVPTAGAIHQLRHFGYADELMPTLEDSLFRYCSLSRFSIDGGQVTSVFLSTSFAEVDWYSGLFNLCDFIACRFEGCIFRGTSFTDCRFVDCRFSDCKFVPDNLGGECVFDRAKWYGCLQDGCEGLPDAVPTLKDEKGKAGKRSRRWR